MPRVTVLDPLFMYCWIYLLTMDSSSVDMLSCYFFSLFHQLNAQSKFYAAFSSVLQFSYNFQQSDAYRQGFK